jgi:hypothetical protein
MAASSTSYPVASVASAIIIAIILGFPLLLSTASLLKSFEVACTIDANLSRSRIKPIPKVLWCKMQSPGRFANAEIPIRVVVFLARMRLAEAKWGCTVFGLGVGFIGANDNH